MTFQSLYRRYRPQRFEEVIGQDHLVGALRNAVVGDRVAHAYLLSGPRGTGKTTTARILAKALNCEDLGSDGEPCGRCDSCTAIERGTSMDLYELDAASNNSVENIRALNESVALGTPGRRKVYLLDEVHMLSRGASNALLKTLEEPPDHVVFILATTDPQKVLPTVRSRTQNFELSLIGADLLAEHVRGVAERAGIAVDDDTVDHVVAQGRGSVRDTLSALDRFVVAGGVDATTVDVGSVTAGLAERDTSATLGAVARIVAGGVDPRDLAEQLTRELRDMFLVHMDVEPGQLPPGAVERLKAAARHVGPAACVRALETLGTALVDMRQAPDPRLTLEVALVRLTAPETDVTVESLLQRIERLERLDRTGRAAADRGEPSTGSGAADAARSAVAAAPAPRPPPPQPEAATASVEAPPPPPPPARPEASSADPPPPPPPSAQAARPASSAAAPVTQPASSASSEDRPSLTSGVSRDQLALDWPEVLERISKRARARLNAGRWQAMVDSVASFAVPNEPHRQRCLEFVPEIETALGEHYGTSVTVRLVTEAEVGSGSGGNQQPAAGDLAPASDDPAVPVEADEEHDLDDTIPAEGRPHDSVSRITEAFPGAVVVEGER